MNGRGLRGMKRFDGAITATATFDGTQDTVAVTWPATRANPPRVVPGAPTIKDGTAVGIWLTNTTSTGATVNTSARFSGTVDVSVFDDA